MPDSQPFHLGQIVRLKSQPDKIGAVVEVKESAPEYQYTVLIDGKALNYFASQLIPNDESNQSKQVLSVAECKALLTGRLINHPNTSTLYSLNAARIDFVPYQYRPVLRFIRADRPRLLIADDRAGEDRVWEGRCLVVVQIDLQKFQITHKALLNHMEEVGDGVPFDSCLVLSLGL